MNRIRLLPVVVMAIAALLVLKTLGLVTNGGYVLTGVGRAQASGAASGGGEGGTTEADLTITPTAEPTIEDTSPTLEDITPTLGDDAAAGGGHGAPAAAAEGGDHGAPAAAAEGGDHSAPAAEGEAHAATPAEGGDHAAPAEGAEVAATTPGIYCVEPDAILTESGEAILLNEDAAAAHGATPSTGEAESAPPAEGDAAATDAAAAAEGGHGAPAEGEAAHEPESTAAQSSFAETMIDCLPSGDAIPMEIGPDGKVVALGTASDTATDTEQALLERLVNRRNELQQYEQDLTLRASIVDAAEKRIEERAATLQALETQISTLVDQRQEMETGQFAGIVAMYEAMKPKDAANIFNNLDMSVLLQVAKTMSPRKMAPILASMDAPRAQELTVAMANLSAQPPTEMSPEDLAALPQIVGQ